MRLIKEEKIILNKYVYKQIDLMIAEVMIVDEVIIMGKQAFNMIHDMITKAY